MNRGARLAAGTFPRYGPAMPSNRPNAPGRGAHHLVLVVSDGSGVTGERVVGAAVTQFDPECVQVERRPKIRDPEQIRTVVAEAAERRATVLYSLVSVEHRGLLLSEARRHGVWTIDLLGPLLLRLSEVLEVAPRAQAGLFRSIDEEYFRRIDAIDFAVKHDDGKRAHELDNAELVLVGVSRSSKTPLSMFLAYRGWHVANVPIVLNIEPPPRLLSLDPAKVVGLCARPDWLSGVRRERSRRMAPGMQMEYSEPSYIEGELRWFQSIAARGGWTVIDVTHKAIEETAAEIIGLLRRQPG